METQTLTYDWNVREGSPDIGRAVELDDETLRDGIQSPSISDPPIEKKLVNKPVRLLRNSPRKLV